MELLKYVYKYIEIFILLICVILYTRSFIKESDNNLKYFTYYLVITFLVQTFSGVLNYYNENNLYLSHFYFIPQFILLSQFYKHTFNRFQTKIVNTIMVVVILTLTLQYSYTPSLFSKFNVLEIFITSFPIVVYSIMYLYNSLVKKGRYMLINAAILMYLSTSTLIFILGDYFSSLNENNLVVNIWNFNRVLYIIFLLLILVEWNRSIKLAKNK